MYANVNLAALRRVPKTGSAEALQKSVINPSRRHIRTGSGPGSPARQPRWGDGSDRVFRSMEPQSENTVPWAGAYPVATAPGSDMAERPFLCKADRRLSY